MKDTPQSGKFSVNLFRREKTVEKPAKICYTVKWYISSTVRIKAFSLGRRCPRQGADVGIIGVSIRTVSDPQRPTPTANAVPPLPRERALAFCV